MSKARWTWFGQDSESGFIKEGIECSQCHYRPKLRDYIKKRQQQFEHIIPVETNYDIRERCPKCKSIMEDISAQFKEKAAANLKSYGELSEETKAYDIEVLGMPTRVANSLKRRKHYTIKDLLSIEEAHRLFFVPGFGIQAYNTLKATMKQYGYDLPEPYEDGTWEVISTGKRAQETYINNKR